MSPSINIESLNELSSTPQTAYLANEKPSFKNKEDCELWDDFKNGDQNALSQIYRTHYKNLYSYGVKITGNGESVKDCIQELFLDLWKKREQLNEVTSIRPYLLKSLKNKILRMIEKDNRNAFENSIADNYNFEFIDSSENDIIWKESVKARGKKILIALNKLNSKQREAIFLKYYLNMSYQEIASAMSINYQSVRNYMYEAIKILKKNMDAHMLISFGLSTFFF